VRGPVQLLWTVERIEGVIVATLRSSDRVINTLPTPIVLKFRRAFAHDAIEVPIAPGAVWYAPVTVQESFTVTLRPGSVPMGYKSSASFGWATAAPAPHIATVRARSKHLYGSQLCFLSAMETEGWDAALFRTDYDNWVPQIHTGEREEGEVEASCKIGSTHAISTTSSRPWAVGLKMAFVRGGSGSPGDMAVLPSSRPAAGKCVSIALPISQPRPREGGDW
jgi:hypothetical protein